MDFLSTAVWIFDFLVMGLLPVISIMLVAIYTYRILKAVQDGTGRFMEEQMAEVKK